MALGRPAKLLKTTALSDFLKKFREGKGLTQPELEAKLNLPRAYVSKLETGTVQLPKADVLESISRMTGKTVEELKMLANEPASEDEFASVLTSKPSTSGHLFQLAFGHCLWASPLVVALTKGLLPNFRVASFSQFENDDLSPFWIDGDSYSQLFHGSVKVPGQDRTAVSLSAADAIKMLEAKDIDVAAIPGNLIRESRFSWLVRIGTMVDSSSGCTLICDDKLWGEIGKEATRANFGHQETTAGLSIPSRRLGARLVKLRDALPNIAVERGTVAEEVLHDSFSEMDVVVARDIWWDVKVDFRNSEFSGKQAFEKLKKLCPNRKNGVGVITWQPHATWAKQDGFNNECQIPFSRGPDARPRHLTFELVMRRDDAIGRDVRSRELRQAVYRLMQALNESASSLNQVDSNSRVVDRDAVDSVGKYFGLTVAGVSSTQKCEAEDGSAPVDYRAAIHAIGSIRFSVKWDTEALELMGFRPT